MESHRCASAMSDSTESMASSHEQHCSQVSQQMISNISYQAVPHHLPGHSHALPEQAGMVVSQQYITAEQNVHYGQVQRTLSDHPAVCLASPGDGQLTSSVQLNTQTYSEVNSHLRNSNLHEPAPLCGSMSGPVMAMPGQVHHSPKAVHQNVEGMIAAGHMPGGNVHMRHGGYYPVPRHGQQMQTSAQMSWHSQRHYMSAGGQGAVQGQPFVSGVQTRFNSQASVPFRGQHPQYALNQEYGDVYCPQYRLVYGELNSGSRPRGTCPPQQHCVGPNGQRMVFARQSMHGARYHPHMPTDAHQFVYYTPHSGSGASQRLSPSWLGSPQMMRSGVSVGYGNQPSWHRPMAIAYGSPHVPCTIPDQRISDYHFCPEPQMTAEFCDNFGGTRQHSSPLHSFSPGSVHCYRPSSDQEIHTGMICGDERYAGASLAIADRNPNSTSSSQEYVPPIVNSTDVSTASLCRSAGSDISSKDSSILTHTTVPSHPPECLPDGRTSLPYNSCVSGTAASSLTSYSHTGYYSPGTNMSGSWHTSPAVEYYSYNSASQYDQQQQHTNQHVNPYNYYCSPPPVPYSGTPHYPSARCHHPYQSHAVQRQVSEHPLLEHRNVLPDKVASQHTAERVSLTTVPVTTCCGSVNITCSALNVSSSVFLTSAAVTSCKVDIDKQNLDYTDDVNNARTVLVQSTAKDHHISFPVSLNNTPYSSVARALNYSPISEAVLNATGTVVTLPASTVDSTSMMPSVGASFSPVNKDVLLLRDIHMENVAAVTPETESINCLQITSSTSSSSLRSPKGPKRSGSQKGTKKTKKKKANLPVDADDTVTVTGADAVKCDPVKSVYSGYDKVSTVTDLKSTSGAESVDHLCPVSSSCSEQAAVVVPYGWRRHVDNGTVVYCRLHSLIYRYSILLLV